MSLETEIMHEIMVSMSVCACAESWSIKWGLSG